MSLSTGFRLGLFPRGPLAFGVAGTAEETLAAEGLFDDDVSLFALRALNAHFLQIFLGVFTIRKAGTGNELAEPADTNNEFALPRLVSGEAGLFSLPALLAGFFNPHFFSFFFFFNIFPFFF